MTFEPSPKDIAAARAECHDWMEVDLTDEQARELLMDPAVASELLLGGMDTCTREAMGKVLAQRVVGRPWPTYGDGKEAADRFYEEFRAKAPEKGYTLCKG
jgi:hypothetical protein